MKNVTSKNFYNGILHIYLGVNWLHVYRMFVEKLRNFTLKKLNLGYRFLERFQFKMKILVFLKKSRVIISESQTIHPFVTILFELVGVQFTVPGD